MNFDTSPVEQRLKQRLRLSFNRRVKFRTSEIKLHNMASRTSTPTLDEHQSTEISHVSLSAIFYLQDYIMCFLLVCWSVVLPIHWRSLVDFGLLPFGYSLWSIECELQHAFY